LELILVDDGSADSGGKICDEFALKDSRVKVFHQKNSGVSSARNFGLKKASGKYLAFVDSDDFLEQQMYEKMISEMNENGATMIVGNWFVHDENLQKIVKSDIGKSRIISAEEYKVSMEDDSTKVGGGYPWNRVIDLEFLRGSWKSPVEFRENLNFHEDKIWLIEISPFLSRIKLSEYAGYHYFVRKESLSHAIRPEHFENVMESWKVLEEVCGKFTETAQKRCVAECCNAIFTMCRIGAKNSAEKYWNDYKKFFFKWNWLKRPKNFLKTVFVFISFYFFR
jgi:glycosyltransferase involved in cell wall biosynthesis